MTVTSDYPPYPEIQITILLLVILELGSWVYTICTPNNTLPLSLLYLHNKIAPNQFKIHLTIILSGQKPEQLVPSAPDPDPVSSCNVIFPPATILLLCFICFMIQNCQM